MLAGRQHSDWSTKEILIIRPATSQYCHCSCENSMSMTWCCLFCFEFEAQSHVFRYIAQSQVICNKTATSDDKVGANREREFPISLLLTISICKMETTKTSSYLWRQIPPGSCIVRMALHTRAVKLLAHLSSSLQERSLNKQSRKRSSETLARLKATERSSTLPS
jgi:hypothetical protein